MHGDVSPRIHCEGLWQAPQGLHKGIRWVVRKCFVLSTHQRYPVGILSATSRASGSSSSLGGLCSEHLTSLPSSFWGPLLDPLLLVEVKGSVTTLSFCGG